MDQRELVALTQQETVTKLFALPGIAGPEFAAEREASARVADRLRGVRDRMGQSEEVELIDKRKMALCEVQERLAKDEEKAQGLRAKLEDSARGGSFVPKTHDAIVQLELSIRGLAKLATDLEQQIKSLELEHKANVEIALKAEVRAILDELRQDRETFVRETLALLNERRPDWRAFQATIEAARAGDNLEQIERFLASDALRASAQPATVVESDPADRAPVRLAEDPAVDLGDGLPLEYAHGQE